MNFYAPGTGRIYEVNFYGRRYSFVVVIVAIGQELALFRWWRYNRIKICAHKNITCFDDFCLYTAWTLLFNTFCRSIRDGEIVVLCGSVNLFVHLQLSKLMYRHRVNRGYLKYKNISHQ